MSHLSAADLVALSAVGGRRIAHAAVVHSGRPMRVTGIRADTLQRHAYMRDGGEGEAEIYTRQTDTIVIETTNCVIGEHSQLT